MANSKLLSERRRLLGDGPIARANARLRGVLEDIETVLSAPKVTRARKIETAQALVRLALEYRGEE